MKRLRTTRRTMIATTALAALALSGAAVTTAGADAPEKPEKPEKKSSSKGFASTVVDFGANTSEIEVENPEEPEDRDPTVDATNNTLAVSPNERLAVATNSHSDHLVVIDVHSGRKIAEIKGYVSPRNILFAPDSKSFTVSDSAHGVVDRISVFGFRVTRRLPLGAGVFGTAQTRDGKWLYANNAAADTVTVVDLGSKDRTMRQIGGFHGLRAVSVNRAGDRLYAANTKTADISVVDTASGTTITTVPVGEKPYGAALSPARRSASAPTQRRRGCCDDLTVAGVDVEHLRVTDVLGD
ncbi:YncE family protein [Streptomyces sp. NPDC060275]|uniref:YncE family protein n=1 Tax=Streptomyces sp. NPDC060275 TaxID=3347090 RepID=UPI0036499A36